ncbi:hypothetical protein PR003_g27023 [Phytophthora rubi]|uniref:Reverse transcriptase domain-containing protein n=1 Tax=Phytophthora rubi TaxID=129364 RepID=A0A6A3H756_9STRA|nr:hypothetical protein PR001_g28924 [Phytophthora rubi]KAE9283816.1 hypothetical protein PR003_g27023 [Phytophthora rubi]
MSEAFFSDASGDPRAATPPPSLNLGMATGAPTTRAGLAGVGVPGSNPVRPDLTIPDLSTPADSVEKTAFTCKYWLFEWFVMPFGLCDVVLAFERLMENVLVDLKWQTCLVYLDDCVVSVPTFLRFWYD